MKKLTQQEIHEKLFEILCVFDDYCKKYSISYFLCGGTMLGAIRHQGFIPWDDDIDVMLLRPEYEKLEMCLKEHPFPLPYVYLSYTFANSVLPFAKLINQNIAVCEKVNATDSYLWIDIFPIDAIPNDLRTCTFFLKRAKHLSYAHSMSEAPIGSGTTLIRGILKLPFLLYRHMMVLILDKNYYTKKIIKMCQAYDYEIAQYVGVVSWCVGEAERFLKTDFYPVVQMDFENRKFPVPANWQIYLKQLYGNYMQLPPIHQRQGHMYEAYEINQL